jgi:hypothetical protein
MLRKQFFWVVVLCGGQFLPEVSKNYGLVYGLLALKMKMVCPFKHQEAVTQPLGTTA